MKAGIKPVIILLAIIIALLNIYKSLKLFSNPDFPYDARNVYLAGTLWLKGENPYNDNLLKAQWNEISKDLKITTTKQPGFPDCGMIYPFWSIPSLFAYFMFKWDVARVFIWVLSVILLGVNVFFASQIFKDYGYKCWQILLLVFCFKSTVTAIALGQPMLFSLASLLASWHFYKKEKTVLSGFLLGIAYSKISLCLPFVLFFLVNKNFKLLLVSAVFPIMCIMAFYQVSGNLYLGDMLENISSQMQINYPGHIISAVNTNLSELGILLNYFGNIHYKIIEKINLVSLFSGFIILSILFKKKFLSPEKYLSLLILCSFMFSYHLIYDCILLLFILLAIKKPNTVLIIALPLFLPINGIFKNIHWLHFHLPVVIAVLFLYLIFEGFNKRNLQNSI